MFGSATLTTVMSSRSMNVVVQTATSVQRRSRTRAGSIAAILGNRPPQRRNGPRAVSYEGDGEVGRDEYRRRRAPALSPVRVNSRPYTESVETATGTLYRLDRGYVAGQRARGRGVPRAHGLERGRLARARRGAARAAADAEEPDRRTATRRARRAGVVSADHRGRAGGERRLDPAPRSVRGEVRDRARSRTAATCSSGPARGFATTTTASRPSRAGTRTSARPPSPTRSSSGCGSRPARRPGAASSTRRSSPPRPGSTRRTSPSPRAATPARSRSRGCTTAAARTAGCGCSRSMPRARRRDLPRREGRRPGHERRPGMALGYVRREVPDDAVLRIGGAEARLHLATPRP